MLVNVPAADQRTEVGNDGRTPIPGVYVKAKAALAALVAAIEVEQLAAQAVGRAGITIMRCAQDGTAACYSGWAATGV